MTSQPSIEGRSEGRTWGRPEGQPAGRAHVPAPLGWTSLDLLDRARASLLEACGTNDAGERYVEAHLGALRAAAAVLAARGGTGPVRGGASGGRAGRPTSPAPPAAPARSRLRSVWELLPRVAPELGEWSAFFAASARRRAAAERGGRVTAREADDLLRESETFLEIVRELLGLPQDDALAPISRYVAAVTPSWGTRGT